MSWGLIERIALCVYVGWIVLGTIWALIQERREEHDEVRWRSQAHRIPASWVVSRW